MKTQFSFSSCSIYFFFWETSLALDGMSGTIPYNEMKKFVDDLCREKTLVDRVRDIASSLFPSSKSGGHRKKRKKVSLSRRKKKRATQEKSLTRRKIV